MTIGRTRDVDIVIVGGGLAALRAAVTAAHSGLRVDVLVKDHLCTGSSFYPMMEMVACQSSDGTPEGDARFLREIDDTSLKMGSPAMNRLYVARIGEAVRCMPELGIEPRLTDPKPACFARTARPTWCWSDWNAIRTRARALLASMPNVTVRECTFAVDLIVRDGALAGVTASGPDGLFSIACKSVVLATGGFGDLFEHSLNTPDVSGDGQALALAAGAQLINMEFLQFIPGFLSPAYKTVFRETALPYAARMRTDDGRDLLSPYLSEEADRVACIRERATHGPFTSRGISKWFDIAMMEEILQAGADRGFRLRYAPEIREVRFTFLTDYVRWLSERRGVDIVEDDIRIAPFYHAANGGVWIDGDCQTAVKGLLACGEVTGGIHGADRQGGNSTGSCLVFGEIAAAAAVRYAQGHGLAKLPADEARSSLEAHYGRPPNARLKPDDILPPLRRLMWFHANVVREEAPLLRALDRVTEWRAAFDPLGEMADARRVKAAAKTAHLLTVAEVLLRAARWRKESRGSHYRSDFPVISGQFDKRLALSIEGGRIAEREVPCELA
ncbi:MAG: FAD-binding protein [Christensenellaceae bacterium]|nr:FAD-binding protein [Christensenellaceae bacterium]MEA5070147.1 FAD-binding protein [Christensenellaceae bacterium]